MSRFCRMKCKNCDSEIPEGKLECPFCGTEVILVPEYMSADMEREKQRLEQEEEERFRREIEERREQRRRERQMKPGAKVLCAFLIAAVFAALALSGRHLIVSHMSDSFGYVREMAFREYRDGHYGEALAFAERGLEIRERSEDLLTLRRRILAEQRDRAEREGETPNQPARGAGGE